MNQFLKQLLISALLVLCAAGVLSGCAAPSQNTAQQKQIHPWEMQEIVLHAEKPYEN